MKTAFLAVAIVAVTSLPLWAGSTPAPEGAAVYFVNLENGASVQSPVTVVFGLSGMGVAPAGTEKDATGHHHLLIDRPPFGEGEEDADMSESGIYSDGNHVHFGGGQTEVSVDLEPGEHTLQLVLGDQNHVPHDPPVMSKQISITVTE